MSKRIVVRFLFLLVALGLALAGYGLGVTVTMILAAMLDESWRVSSAPAGCREGPRAPESESCG